MTRRSIWYNIRGSLWFVPFLFFLFSAASALALVELDRWLDAGGIARLPDSMVAGPDGAREILTVISGSTITIAGVIFSVTIVTLSLAAAQYSPRVLRSFMRDRLNQSVLGVLVGVFTYSLLVLRSIRSNGVDFVPQISLWFGILFVLVAIGFFIAFIHNTAVSIQAPEIVSRIAHETTSALDAARKTSLEGGTTEEHGDQLKEVQWETVPSRKSGYVQDIDIEGLFEIASRKDLVLKVEAAVGDFIVAGRPIVRVGNGAEVDPPLEEKIQDQFGIDSYRTVDQDPAFGIRQLVDIALKALSPSVNDTTTAIHCIDYLGVILHKVFNTSRLPRIHLQEDKVRLVIDQPQIPHLIDVALNEIRQNTDANMAVLLRLFKLMGQMLEDTDDPLLQEHIRNHIRLTSENIDRYVPSSSDRTVAALAADHAMNAGQ